MKHNLYLMCGLAGAGKSTWLKDKSGVKISRDDIRFSLVDEDSGYFSKEKEVFKTFVNEIQTALDNDDNADDVYCDATHLTHKSRSKLLNALDLGNVNNITVIVVYPSLKEVLKRNRKRTGRRYVPEYAIFQMWSRFERPEYDEDKIFDVMYVEVPEDE